MFVVATLAPMGLAALVAIMLPGLERAVARAVTVLGSLTAAGLVLTWMLSFGAGNSRPGAGILVTAVASVVAAVSASSARGLPSRTRPGATAGSLLPPISIKAAPLPPSDLTI